jgi:hypothetical protein
VDASEANVKKVKMQKPAEMDILLRAYELREQGGKPAGRHRTFYHQAEQEMQNATEQAFPE